MAKRKLVTLLTDFGREGPYVAAMKGVLLSGCPDARIVDISHEVPVHDVLAAGLVLAHTAPWFPPGTLHVVVVDPTVGTDRQLLYARFGGRQFLFPDNGVISLVAASMPLEMIRACRNAEHVPSAPASSTFHGRDVFAPLAARLLEGLDPRLLGPTPQTYKMLDTPQLREEPDRIVGQVLYVDHFGNLVSNISADRISRRWQDPDRTVVFCAGSEVGTPVVSYGYVEPGRPLALINSMGLLEVAVNQGRACDLLSAGVGDEVSIVSG